MSVREHLLDERVLLERVLPRIKVVGECWLWTGARRGGGKLYGNRRYGVIQVRPHGLFDVHRLVYHFLVRPLEEGEVVDHRHACRLGHCVVPTSLDAVSVTVNAWRSNFAVPAGTFDPAVPEEEWF